ncbi:chaperone NapD [Cellvibrio fontiphilus]|jgi:nitrate reductase NapD|uniref:Chaperone NapD n=1 Tax=Cellvibrio fontiphilus TaxID=1815559 RepID=A0ABV7F999_9GAMM
MSMSMPHSSPAALIATETLNPPPTHLHIASFIAHVRPEQMNELKHWLQACVHFEIHAEHALGKLVLVTESNNEQQIVQRLDELRAQAGVLNAALVYHEQIALEELAAEEQPL